MSLTRNKLINKRNIFKRGDKVKIRYNGEFYYGTVLKTDKEGFVFVEWGPSNLPDYIRPNQLILVKENKESDQRNLNHKTMDSPEIPF